MEEFESSKQGFIYILTNPFLKDGIVKIGMTSRNAEVRASELYDRSTGVPSPFEVFYQAHVAHREVAEQLVHLRLSKFRTSPNREFFEVSPNTAKEVAEKVVKEVNQLYSKSEALDKQPNGTVKKKADPKKKVSPKPDHRVRLSLVPQRITQYCSECCTNYSVTLMSDEVCSRCPDCLTLNKISSSRLDK